MYTLLFHTVMSKSKTYLLDKTTIKTLSNSLEWKIINPLIDLIQADVIQQAYIVVQDADSTLSYVYLSDIYLMPPELDPIQITDLKDLVIKGVANFIYGTPFQREVWKAIANIKFGEVMTYSELAAQIGKPTAGRAVANACGDNPYSIIYPCHRVVPVGYKRYRAAYRGVNGYRWGSDLKEKILNYEASAK
jgi:O-6-methylguanine DNA methyltransferase